MSNLIRNIRQITRKNLKKTIFNSVNNLIPKSWLGGVAIATFSLAHVLLSGTNIPVAAAERLTLRIGPFEQSIKISDLDKFAKTGDLPSNLKPYGTLLTPELRQFLNRRIELDPKLGDKLVKDFLRSPAGETLVKKLGVAIPDSSVEQVQGAIALAVRQTKGLSLLSFLRAYPDENLTLDASSVLSLALEFNVPYWQSQALSSLLERELNVSTTPFRADFDPAATGSQKVEQETLTFQDKQRQRTILVEIYSARNTEGPLVVLSHGFGADKSSLAYLGRHLASYGFTVAAIEHPGSNARSLYSKPVDADSSKFLEPSEFLNRPKDISFMLDELEKVNQQSGSLQGKINTQQVTAIGHSLGGYTVLALAGGELNLDDLRKFCKERSPIGKSGGDWLQCIAADLPNNRLQLQDKRISQAIALNPLVGEMFGKKGLSKVTIPTLILTSTDDALTPSLSHQLQPFTQLGGSKYLLTAIGGTHLSVTDPANLTPELSKLTLVREKTGTQVAPLRQMVKGVSLAFIKQQTLQAKIYEPFLTPGYAQSLSTSELPLRLNAELPASVTSWLGLAILP